MAGQCNGKPAAGKISGRRLGKANHEENGFGKRAQELLPFALIQRGKENFGLKNGCRSTICSMHWVMFLVP
jgi:hypothetical protein